MMASIRIFVIILQIGFICAMVNPEDNEDLTTKEKDILMNVEYAHTDPHGRDFDAIHSSILLGSVKSKEAFGHLDYKDREKKLAELYKEMDTNQDAHIQISELEQHVLKSLRNIGLENALTMLRNEDSNVDDKLSWRELLDRRYGYTERQLTFVRRDSIRKKDKEMFEVIKQIEDDREHFKMADINKDGYLSVEEFAMFSYPWQYSHMYKLDVQRNVKKFDADKDGYLNLEEYLKLRHANQKDPVDMDLKKRRFYKLDTNKDKKLGVDELSSAFKSSMERKAEREAKHIMKEVDSDKDDVLSFEEMSDKLNTMLGTAHDVKTLKRDEL